jgi:Tfp pilus assembly protein PilX
MPVKETQQNKMKNADSSRSISYGTQKGFTLFMSLVLAGTLLLIASGVVNLAVKQSLISSSGRESQLAFYAADTGMECALFWDVKNPEGEQSAFATTTTSTITCNQDAANPDNEWVVGGADVSMVEYITFLPEPYCAKVIVTKHDSGTTTIESLGYNTCDLTNPRRVERAVRATY